MQLSSLEFWIDLNLPPKMAKWLQEDFHVAAKSFKELNFETTTDIDIYKKAAKNPNVIISTTKDIDFINFQQAIGAPPKILYINVGNISNDNLKLLIQNKFAQVLELFLKTNKSLIEISTL